MRTFDPARFAVVETGANLLLRGNIPLDPAGEFAYDAVRAGVRAGAGVDLLDYRLLDVCLIDNVSERHLFEPEVRAFGIDPAAYPPAYWPPWTQPGWRYGAGLGTGTVTSHGEPHYGDIVWWPIEAPCGAPVGPFLGTPGWNLDGLVAALQGWLASAVPLAIYVHCTLGADRTGAALGAYLIESRGMTAALAIEEVTRGTPAGVAPSAAYQALIRAFAAQRGY